MQAGGPLDPLPLWAFFLITVAVVLLSIEGGFRLGTYRRGRSEGEDKPPVGEMVAATLALLAFILAFTFGLAGPPAAHRRGGRLADKPRGEGQDQVTADRRQRLIGAHGAVAILWPRGVRPLRRYGRSCGSGRGGARAEGTFTTSNDPEAGSERPVSGAVSDERVSRTRGTGPSGAYAGRV
jgi:hypothetical protein